ncbi:AAA family ATPase, partial [candidate division WWE3 bacterium]|nr:AAA family ATPase [candidate division WWE3 bacterium]
PTKQFQQMLDDLVDMLEMKELLHVQVRKLSLGQRMKAELIAALLHRPRVLFLDEPTIGLDVVMQQKMREFIKDYNERYGATIILTSHYMGDIKELCKRVVMIDQGHIGFDGPLQRIIEQYATHKHLTVVFSEDVDQVSLEKIGRIAKQEFPRVEIEVPRAESSQKAAQLLSEFPVADLTIEDTPIEEIVRNVFKNHQE